MIKRIVGGLVAVVVGGTAAHGAYAGHGGKAGDFCEFTLQQNNAVMATLNNADTSFAAGNAALVKAAGDLRARDTTGVKPSVLAAANDVAAAMEQQAQVTSAAEDTSAAAAYNSALQRLASACNMETGQSVKVVDGK